MKRVALLTNIPSPYRIPFFYELSRLCTLHIVFDARTESNRTWHVPEQLPFAHSYARGWAWSYMRRRSDGFPADRRVLHLRWGMLLELLRLRPDVVVANEFGGRSLFALLYCTLRRRPMILWSEGTPHTEGWVGGPKLRVRRLLARRSSRAWVNGADSRLLIEQYGGSAGKCDLGLTGVDTGWFAAEAARLAAERAGIRSEFGIDPGRTVFVVVAQMIGRKGIRQLLGAAEQLGDEANRCTVLLCGDGEERGWVESWAAAHPQLDVRLLGFLPPEQLVRVYAASDVFVLPTLDDNWALATLEGAVVGLPQIFSRYNGATTELMEAGVPGEVIDPLNETRFAEVLRRMCQAPPARPAPELVAALVDYYSPAALARRAYRSILAAGPLAPDKAARRD